MCFSRFGVRAPGYVFLPSLPVMSFSRLSDFLPVMSSSRLSRLCLSPGSPGYAFLPSLPVNEISRQHACRSRLCLAPGSPGYVFLPALPVMSSSRLSRFSRFSRLNSFPGITLLVATCRVQNFAGADIVSSWTPVWVGHAGLWPALPVMGACSRQRSRGVCRLLTAHPPLSK